MPPGFLDDRARAVVSGQTPPAVPRNAATVVVLRDAPAGGTEAYLLRRVATMAFAAGMYVFPGGSVDPQDADGHHGWAGPEPAQWAGLLAADAALSRALVCAAVRETFEESGVLLAGPSEHEVVDASGPEWEAERVALEAREQSLSQLLERRELVLRADLLRPWAHWITPEAEPKRFDTRFFVAALPAGQVPRDVGGEADRTLWLSPAQALERHARGELGMLPPTSFTLTELSAFDSVDAVLAAATQRDVQPVLPKVVVSGEEAVLLLPHEEGYEQDGAG